ncbi:MAG: response regulator [Calditrichia bacterium]
MILEDLNLRWSYSSMVNCSERKARVLVVEDNQESVDLLVYFLNPAGYEVYTANDGLTALEMVKTVSPDIILLDIMLPGMDGYQVCERLKKDKSTFHIPIIMITALKELKDKIRALESGADDFVSKPFDNVELLTRVKSLLRLKFYHDELLRRNRELEEQKQALMREDLLKKELTNLIVHDMKNPLFVIQGNLQMMALSKEAVPSAQQEVYTKRIARSSRSLLRMILNLLDISRLEQKQMEIEPIPTCLNDMVNDIVESIRDIPEHQTKSVQIKEHGNPLTVYVDKEIFERVLDNLFHYVFQNTPDYKSIVIEAEEVEGQKVILRVTHDGVPIPEKFKKKIFSKAAQPELKKAGFKPARGLGLLFCKLALEVQKGKIYLDENIKDKNSFVLELPTLKVAPN